MKLLPGRVSTDALGPGETAAGIRVHDVSSVRLGSNSGRRYRVSLNHALTFHAGVGIGSNEHDVTLLGVRDGTIVIRKMGNLSIDAGDKQALREAERVIQSFRFQS